MTVKCRCTECHCTSQLFKVDKDGKYICSSCRLGKHLHTD
ncbi:MAG: hypothetical protein KGI25_02590 [Thaumarchaeota archaeon]|nr:hypothetical protein [Nitrososphaerota archaeon]